MLSLSPESYRTEFLYVIGGANMIGLRQILSHPPERININGIVHEERRSGALKMRPLPLTFAIGTGFHAAVPLLLAAGADPCLKDDENRCAFICALHQYKPQTLQSVVDAGGDVNARLPDGGTGLHYAAAEQREDVLRHLLQVGTDPSIRNNKGQTAAELWDMAASLIEAHTAMRNKTIRAALPRIKPLRPKPN